MSGRASQIATYRAFVRDVKLAIGWRLPAQLGVMSIVAFTDGLSVTLLLPLLSRIGIVSSNSAAARLINRMLDAITPAGSGLIAILAVIIFLSATQMSLAIFQGWWGSGLIHRYEMRWKVRLFEAFLNSDWLFLTGRKGGELSSAVAIETGRLGGSFYYFTLLTSTVIACAIYFLLAMLVTWRATLMLLALVVLMVLSISPFYRLSHAAGHRTGALNAELQVLVNESLAGAKIIKATVSEDQAIRRVDAVSQAIEKVGRTRLFLPNVVRAIFEFMSFVALAVFFGFGMGSMHVAAGDVMVVLALFVRLLPKITNAQTLVHEFNVQVPAILIATDILAEATAKTERASGAIIRVAPPTRLEVRDLHAGYGNKPVLNGLTLALDVPGMVGIVGGSGAGKSTLVHILLGLIEPFSGTVTLGQYDMREVSLNAWRREIGYVPQETMFFHASVTQNLALAKPEATREEIIAAAKRAHAHDFIMALPQGYDTSIGDQGVLLSGGQRQRLGIARALLAKPALLLMDEPTSALDPKSENEILATLSELRRSVGIIIVAHRLTTVQEADRIYVLDEGRVVESGAWSELIARRDRFHSLAKLQQIVA